MLILFESLTAFLFLILIILLIKFIKLKRTVKTLSVAYKTLDSIVASAKGNLSDSEIHKENFIKFLSDSRDWAYEYIETVQDGLGIFIDAVDADISYFDEYGDVLSNNRPDYNAMKNISKAYKDLKKLLPEEES